MSQVAIPLTEAQAGLLRELSLRAEGANRERDIAVTAIAMGQNLPAFASFALTGKELTLELPE